MMIMMITMMAMKWKEPTTAQNKTDDTEPPSGKNPHGSEVERIHNSSGGGDVILMIMMPETRRQGVTLWRLLVTLAHNCCKRQLQAEERRSD